MMASGTEDVLGPFRVAYEAMVRFPLLIVPPLAVGILGFVLIFFIGGGVTALGALLGGLVGGGAGVAAGGVAGLVLGVLAFGLTMGLLAALSAGMVVVMARDALEGREPGLGDALGAVLARLGAVLWSSLLVTVVIGVGFLLFVLPGFVAAMFLAFTLPAVLLDGLGAVEGMRRSVAVVQHHLGPAIGFVVGALVVLVGVAIGSWILGLVPVLGGLASFVLHGAGLSYLTVVGVRFYQALATSPGAGR